MLNCLPVQEVEAGISEFKANLGNIVTPHLKIETKTINCGGLEM